MRNFEFFLDKLSALGQIEITCYSHDIFWDLRDPIDMNPVRENQALRDQLIAMTKAHPLVPAVIRDDHNVMYSAILWEDTPVYDDQSGIETRLSEDEKKIESNWSWFFIGPCALTYMKDIELHRYYRSYTDKKTAEKHPPILPYARYISMLQLAAMILEKRTGEEEIIRINELDSGLSSLINIDKTAYSVERDELSLNHHTYDEEQVLLNYVREGNSQDAIILSNKLDLEISSMSQDSLKHNQKLVTVAVTLISRAAIDAGLPPQEAYSLSDYYLRKSDEMKDVPALLALRNQAITDFCEKINTSHTHKRHNWYITQCCDYIHTHYREKIYLEVIAKELHLSPSYLSRLFASEMNIKLQDYIVQVRIERASNLLKYTSEPISKISDYVGFANQSHFSHSFKNLVGVSPGNYRKNYHSESFQ